MKLIDADRRITVTYYDEEYEEWSQKTRTIWDTILEVGDEIPPVVDAIFVVRCQSCKYSYIEEKTLVCGRRGFFVHDDFYCADGDRRTIDE